MPEANPFTFIGSVDYDEDGNVTDGVMLSGFPFCPAKVDVSGFDYWITLGGFKKGDAGSPTLVQIGASIVNASRLFWNFYQINAFNDFDSGGSFNDFINVEGGASRPSGFNNFSGEPEPQDRIFRTSDGFGGFGNNVSLIRPGNNSIALAFHMLQSSGNIVRMYNGATTNEDNFVGYGIFLFGGRFTARNTTNQFGLNIYSSSLGCVVQLASYGNNPTINSGEISDVAYVVFEGMNFVCCAWSRNTNSGVSGTANASALSASWTRVSSFYETSLTSLDFYTYPT